MGYRNGPPPILRRHPRFRRLLLRARTFLVSCRNGGPRQGVPFLAGLAAILVVVLVGTVLPGWTERGPSGGDPAQADVSQGATAGASLGVRPTPSQPVASPGSGTAQPTASPAALSGAPESGSGEDSTPVATPSASMDTDPTSLGGAFGKDCSEGSAGFRALLPLRGADRLEPLADGFPGRKEALCEALSGSTRVFADLPLDASVGTEAFILAWSRVGAENLNGYFYYLYDPSAPGSGIAPLVLVVDHLFDDGDRTRAIADQTFSTPDIEATLRDSLAALLGAADGEKAAGFVTGLYREVFKARVSGAVPTETRRYLALDGVTVVFQDSFMTYVEFLPGGVS